MYLYGSLAYGGFDRDSDVDFVVVTARDLPEPFVNALQAMHARIAALDSWCATQLEGSYIPAHALRTFDPLRVLHLHIDRGRGEQLHRMHIEDERLSHAWWGGWVLLRHVLLESGLTLAGPPPAALIDPLAPGELEQANLATLHGHLAAYLEDPAELASSGYRSYTVLTCCRILYTHTHAAIVSKQVAAHWAQQTLPEPWRTLVEQAWSGRQAPAASASPAEIQATQAFIRYTLEKCK
jgi:hypothetical protein